MWIIIELLIAIIFASLGQVFWKSGLRDIGPIMKYDLSMITKIFFNFALSKKDLGYVYPFIAGTYILVLIFSYFMLGEHFETDRLIGACIVLVGLLFIIKGG